MHTRTLFVLLGLAATVSGCGGILAGRNQRAGRDEFADSTNCPKGESKAKNLGKVEMDNPPPNLMAAHRIEVTGCGQSQTYVCGVFDTGGGGSDVICKEDR